MDNHKKSGMDLNKTEKTRIVKSIPDTNLKNLKLFPIFHTHKSQQHL